MSKGMAILKEIVDETMGLYAVADKCPSSELALIMWKLDKAIVLEEFHLLHGNGFFQLHYEVEQELQYNRLIELGYAPINDDLSWP